MSSWIVKEIDTDKTELITCFTELVLKEAYLRGMCINYSVTHNGMIKEVHFYKN